MVSKDLEQELRATKTRLGLVMGTLEINEYDEAEENFTAAIDPKGWHIKISVKKGYNPIQDRRQKAFARKKKIEDGLKQMLEDVGIYHEVGHWEMPLNTELGCPFDEHSHDLILEAVKKALPQNKQDYASYVANAFEDILVNTRVREYKGDHSGMVLFFDEQGRERDERKYTLFYETFVKLNMHLWADNVDIALVKRNYSNKKNIDDAVKKVIQDLVLRENSPTINGEVRKLFNRSRWPQMAEIFARDLADLLEEIPEERLSAYFPSSEGSGKGEDKKPKPGNVIEEKSETRDGKESIAYGRYAGRNGQTPNMTGYEQLDLVYRRLAKAIPVKVEAMTREHNLDIAPLTYRPFDPETDIPLKIKTSRLFFIEGGITLAYPELPLTVETKSKVQIRSFPDFKMVVLDNSGSMKLAPDNTENIGSTDFIPWGDNSKYHYALLGFYGIEAFLQLQGISQYIRHGLTLFSKQTRYKEGNYQELAEIRKRALSPEFDDTLLDVSVLLKALEGRESFVLSISDGEIGNWDGQKQAFRKAVEGNYYAHIQVSSGGTKFTRDLESWGLPVFTVSNGDELSKLMVYTALDFYKRFT